MCDPSFDPTEEAHVLYLGLRNSIVYFDLVIQDPGRCYMSRRSEKENVYSNRVTNGIFLSKLGVNVAQYVRKMK